MPLFLPADGPLWLRSFADSIKRLFAEKLSRPLWLWTAATVDLPTITDLGANEGAIAYDDTVDRLVWRNSSAWVSAMPYTAGAALTRVSDTNVTLTLGGTPTTALLQATSITAGWSGQLAASRGGTGVSALGDITRVNDTNVTLTLGGIPTGAVITSTSLTLGWSGELAVARGGTGSATAAGARTNLGLVIGTDVQAYDADLTTWAGVTPGTGVATALAIAVGSAGAFVTFNGAGGTPSALTLTNATGLPVSGITASTVTALGVGSLELGHASDTTLARSSAGNVTIEGNLIYRAGGTDVPVADGGTGASTAADARTNLGLVIGTNVQAYDADLDAVASSGVAGAWGTYTPTITALVGTFTSVAGTGRYIQIGKLVHFRVKITITTNGTAAAAIVCPLPVATVNASANFAQWAGGREVAVTGDLLSCELVNNSSTMYVTDHLGAYLGADGYVIAISGTYEAA